MASREWKRHKESCNVDEGRSVFLIERGSKGGQYGQSREDGREGEGAARSRQAGCRGVAGAGAGEATGRNSESQTGPPCRGQRHKRAAEWLFRPLLLPIHLSSPTDMHNSRRGGLTRCLCNGRPLPPDPRWDYTIGRSVSTRESRFAPARACYYTFHPVPAKSAGPETPKKAE